MQYGHGRSNGGSGERQGRTRSGARGWEGFHECCVVAYVSVLIRMSLLFSVRLVDSTFCYLIDIFISQRVPDRCPYYTRCQGTRACHESPSTARGPVPAHALWLIHTLCWYSGSPSRSLVSAPGALASSWFANRNGFSPCVSHYLPSLPFLPSEMPVDHDVQLSWDNLITPTYDAIPVTPSRVSWIVDSNIKHRGMIFVYNDF